MGCHMSYADMIEKIRRIARDETICDDALCKLLFDNGCYYLLSKSRTHASKRMLPVALNSVSVSHWYRNCQEVFEKMKNIPYAHIKGAALSSRIYGNPAYRSVGDIDLLVPPAYSDEIKSILLDNGFVQGKLVDGQIVPFTRQELIYQKSFTHQLSPFIKKIESRISPFINIDVNLDIVWGEGDFSVNMDEFVSHTEDFEIRGVAIRRLKPIWEFISLCMHHYKDMNSIYLIADRGFNLSEYCDIYFYLVNVLPDANELAEISNKYGMSEYVFYCIYYANEIFDDHRLSVYLNKLDSESARKLICCYGLTDSERKEWDMPFYERLFDVEFQERFFASLSDTDQRKVEINRKFM